jgi:putative membrane protein
MATAFNPRLIERPDPLLMRYYFFCSLLALPAFPIVLFTYWCRYITLRYKFDDDGVSMSYGVFFKREVNLTYRRIQDIHVTHNLLQRWMGLATISLQTASGSAQAEMSIEGVLEPERLRDYLYARMRGARDEAAPVVATLATPAQTQWPAGSTGTGAATMPSADGRTLQTLIEIRDALQMLVQREEAKS